MKAAHPEVVAATRVNPGETLRHARESRGWSLADVAKKLNLTQTSLSNLEAGAFDKLPGHTFARGYIRTYAKLLDMDQAVLVQAFDHITGTNAQGSSVHGLGKIEEPSRLAHNILRIVSLLLLVLVIGGGFVWWKDQSDQRAKDAPPVAMEHVEVESADGTTQIHPLDGPDASTDAKQPEAPAAAAGSDAVVGSAPVNPSPATSQPSVPGSTPAPTVTAPVKPMYGSTASSTTPVAPVNTAPVAAQPAAPATAAAAPTPTPAAGEGQVAIQFVENCWIEIKDATGKVLSSGVKKKGDNISVIGKPPFSARLGFARGAQVTYNGQPVDLKPFTSGETARLKLGQ
ncbi:RodZ family helix-turn-helix domain-containing protein [Pseudomonas sp. HR96]|uniref:RodZ family helix-turn-helix domain-containing protein n=1 Tax=Pseudomonas sp. HR96 TaxID=1027966 RepID=UPI002A74780C|nr:RodZ family helix-turn-helix domain-containing protein [Pseudomonas sp. HR96]WPP00838.1 RodZ family helix-turn-helix domain-containing protein [Pseudomonas sp. HR96]